MRLAAKAATIAAKAAKAPAVAIAANLARTTARRTAAGAIAVRQSAGLNCLTIPRLLEHPRAAGNSPARLRSRLFHAAVADVAVSPAASAAEKTPAAEDAPELAAHFFSRVKFVRDFPVVSLREVLKRLQQQQHQLLQQWQEEATSPDAGAADLLRKRLELLRLLLQLQQQQKQEELLKQLPLLQPGDIVALLLGITSTLETLREDLLRVVEAFLVWMMMTSVRAFSSTSSSSGTLRTLLLMVRERLEAASLAADARSKLYRHPCLCVWDSPGDGFLALVEAVPLSAKAALIAAETLHGWQLCGLMPRKPPPPQPRGWRSMDSVDMEAWEASQRRVVRTRWLPTPSGRFLEGRKLAASLALHLHQAAPVASAASLAAMCAAVAERQSLRGSFGQETINAVAHRLLLLEASSLIPWLPVYVHLLHHPFALQGQLAEHLAGRLHHPSLLPTRLLLQICGGLLAAVQAYETLKQSGLVEEKVTHLLLLQVQQDLIQLEKTCLAEAPAAKAAEATETAGLATTIEAEAAEDVDPSPPPATGSATATAAPAAAEAEQLLTAAEGSVADMLMLFNAMAAEGSPMILSTEDYQDALREFLSSNADLDPEALGSLSL
ncbi:hypothetical protein cyc_03941 [Cyclospora cayetanensis]|uniref:Uncharacterized protein n=1 Tax=Cyclospora cayetanensis TaxID=88456 RepID=A0A1D3CTG9_9EIME|nr:hypothetical protein cyc_03941 [Cyclospora cayetanensis]